VFPGQLRTIEQFRHRNLRSGRNRTVHRSTFLPDERGVPAPDCHGLLRRLSTLVEGRQTRH
jgi:hypothetical protein